MILKYRHIKSRINMFVALVAAVLLWFIALNIKVRFDLTSQNLYTLEKTNKDIITNVDKEVLATVLLGRNIPPPFEKLKKETEFLLAKIGQRNMNIRYETFDPNEGSSSQVNALRKLFSEKNVFPTNIRQRDESEIKEQLIYPFVHFQSSDGEVFVNILESRVGQETEQDAIFRSVSLLEDKFAKALYTLSSGVPTQIGYLALTELIDRPSFELVLSLRKEYPVEIVTPEILMSKRDSISVCIVSIERDKIDRRSLLLLDQYVMGGGKIIWMIEEYDIGVDSIGKYGSYLPLKKEMAISDYLFKNGVKIRGAWIADLKSARIPQVIGEVGGSAQTELFNFPYHPVMSGNVNHPITQNLQEINLYFPTLIDTVPTSKPINKIPLVQSSEYSRVVEYPKDFSFEFLRQPLVVEEYDEQSLTAALLLEGEFDSYFKNRLVSNDERFLLGLGQSFQAESRLPSAQIIISDKQFVMPSPGNGNRMLPPGYNKWERMLFEDNFDFLLNSIEYLVNGDRFLNKKTNQITFASLDKTKISESGPFWQLFNLIVPLVLLLITFLGTSFYLKRKYGT